MKKKLENKFMVYKNVASTNPIQHLKVIELRCANYLLTINNYSPFRPRESPLALRYLEKLTTFITELK